MPTISPNLSNLRASSDPWLEVRSVLLYFVVAGRNAWWSTWIRRYSEGSLHHSLASAKAYCEGRRVQGTRFYIEELPSLALVGSSMCLLVSQINTEQPLEALDYGVLRELHNLVGVDTLSLHQLVRVFSRTSRVWSPALPAKDSLLLVTADSSTGLEPCSGNQRPQQWRSRSLGPHYYLKWLTETGTCKTESVVAAKHYFASSRNTGP